MSRNQPRDHLQRFTSVQRAETEFVTNDDSFLGERVAHLLRDDASMQDRLRAISIDHPDVHATLPNDPDPVIRARYYSFYNIGCSSDAQAMHAAHILGLKPA